MIVRMVDLIERSLLKSTNNFILTAKQTVSASTFVFLLILLFDFQRFFRLAFDTFDTNDDGTIDFDEFLLAISATSQGNLDDRLAVAFDM